MDGGRSQSTPLADGGSSPTKPTEITNFGSPSPDSDTTTMPSDASIPSFSPQLKSYVKDRNILYTFAS
jgi:hypothetical protein